MSWVKGLLMKWCICLLFRFASMSGKTRPLADSQSPWFEKRASERQAAGKDRLHNQGETHIHTNLRNVIQHHQHEWIPGFPDFRIAPISVQQHRNRFTIRDTYSIDLLCYKHVLFSRYEKLKLECFLSLSCFTANLCMAAEWEVDPGVPVL